MASATGAAVVVELIQIVSGSPVFLQHISIANTEATLHSCSARSPAANHSISFFSATYSAAHSAAQLCAAVALRDAYVFMSLCMR